MKIKTKLRLNAWISLVVVLLLTLSLAWSFWEMNRIDRKEKLVQEMRETAMERVSLRDEYLLHREERTGRQWVAKSETLRSLLDRASERFTTTEEKARVREARRDFDATFSGFSTILEKDKRKGRRSGRKLDADEVESRLIGQVFLNAYALQEDIGRLYELNERAATEARTRGFALIIVLIVGGIIAVVVNSATLDRVVTKRLMALQEGVGIIGGGNLDHRIDATGDDELSALARASNEMAARLKETYTSVENLQREITAHEQTEEALRESELRFRMLFDKAPLGYQSLDFDGNFIDVNQEWLDTLGYSREEVIGRSFVDFLAPGYRDAFRERFPVFKSSGKIHSEFGMVHKNGERLFIAFDGRIGYDSDGKFKQTHCILKDVTMQRRAEEEIRKLNAELEQRVLDRTAQLENANQELEAFSYSVSHDLRGPLRAIDGFSRIVLEDYGDKLDAEGNRLLNVVRANTQRMDQLITDLLALSRISKSDIRLSRVDMTAMARSIYHEIADAEIRQKFVFTVAPLPDGAGDPALLRQVWCNLLSNAVKFTLPREERRIDVTGRTEGEMNIYSIRDTGVGFNPKFTHKLFGVFQRLHKTEEFEGNGVGLAIVRRIIHRHGGRVWTEGKINEGAVFSFSLPCKEA